MDHADGAVKKCSGLTGCNVPSIPRRIASVICDSVLAFLKSPGLAFTIPVNQGGAVDNFIRPSLTCIFMSWAGVFLLYIGGKND